MEVEFFLDGLPCRARVLEGKEGKEFYREAIARSREKYGQLSNAFNSISFGIDDENSTGSNFFFNNEMNLYLPEKTRVMDVRDMKQIFRTNPDFFSGFYSDVASLVFRSSDSKLGIDNIFLENLSKQLSKKGIEYSLENPVIIVRSYSYLDSNSENSYGLLLESEWAINDSDFRSKKREIMLGETKLRMSNRKSGVCRIFAWDKDIKAEYNNLVQSDSGGRVVIVEKL